MKLNTLILLGALIAPLAHASMDIMAHHPYARATPPNAATSAVFVELMNPTDIDRTIVSASTPVAGKVELHDVINEGDVMKMRQVKQITIPAQSKTSLEPGSLHIMLFELNKPLIEGGSIDVEVVFANGHKQIFSAPIKKVMSGMKHHH
ncbi:copper chaperone PCu(A)C [Vibrio intestinalis]|uniref:copper chaperone PCu(A)C n=1 Tax=Vibrio intestinalis TaxID=2933291 RepID=UPI0021A917C2|nr:copper chaperone PCu(A)C [Vibrio intestinalis]